MFVLKNIVKAQKEMEQKEIEIFSHPAWHDDLSGIECEDLLRGLVPGSYVLRAGERKFHYYLSFVVGDSFTFKHQPFLLTKSHDQTVWGYRNGSHHWASTLDTLISLIIHSPLDQCFPIPQSDGKS